MTKGILYQIISVVRTPAGISAVIGPEDGEERETLLLSGEFWTPLGLSLGDTIDEDTLCDIRRAELLSRAVSRSVKILAGSDHSRSQLLRKLTRQRLQKNRSKIQLVFGQSQYSADNAAGVAWLGMQQYLKK